MPRITIIETGLVLPQLRGRHGSYPEMFQRMIGAVDDSIDFDVVEIANGEQVPNATGLEAILITGSSAGVYEKLGWIPPLEDFVRAAHARQVPMVGVCFGHQLIAQALGGTVRKSENGWGIGRHVYEVVPDNGIIEGRHLAIACSHQDQVVEAPREARSILFSDFTPYAGLLYANGTTLTVQPHPEFDVNYATALCDARKGIAPDAVVAAAKASLAKPLDSAKLGGVISRFLTGRMAP
ncbi:gamma-glutamyl-gamma-aminobutyrate hydrolase family protein [Bradyrhizobium sp. CCGUVB1N3]|uniref:type 1 glutamine amidotransferase n=1 Tax=Bradyrhizobium sp. CCGUVB1N3 TaxID=2949629 RepID=UPI0020B1AD0A|nr:gamma-glutamyl-gamma-aminobutyrate hydrolase family protein [Bradyrhizobium sp. CCGUVB1N3]MCP3472250.1 gamma-glutamyl-gamma-aminobutyrate hydrolase family protein [Bradyrhizobium sp. CCGUVB1N3]